MIRNIFVLIIAVCSVAAPVAQDAKGFDELLDLYVRDGLVYYRALKSDRGKLDRYVAQLAEAAPDRMSRDERLAFWLNAYNALVLRTVVDHYPIQGVAAAYPKNSIRQVAGAFERTPHRVGGRSLTLDQIEQTILPEFHDPRVFLALGRGAVGSSRLRSEAFAAASLETQLTQASAECVSHAQCFQIDRTAGKVVVSSVFSWREKDFAAAYAGAAPAALANRSPIERAVVAFVQPKLLLTEKEFLEQNTFTVAFRPFDWRLNDLTGRGGR